METILSLDDNDLNYLRYLTDLLYGCSVNIGVFTDTFCIFHVLGLINSYFLVFHIHIFYILTPGIYRAQVFNLKHFSDLIINVTSLLPAIQKC